MARDIGDTILQAAQQVVGQLQTQRQLQLQMAQFGEQIKRAEETMKLREDQLAIQEKNVQLRAEGIELETKRAATAERGVEVQEGRLELTKRMEDLKKQLTNAQIANIEARTESLLNKAEGIAKGEWDLNEVGGRYVQDHVNEFSDRVVANNPEQFIDAPPEVLERFRGFPREVLMDHRRRLGQQLIKLQETQGRSEVFDELAAPIKSELAIVDDYLAKFEGATFKIVTGEDKEGRREAMRGLFVFNEAPDKAIDQIFALEDSRDIAGSALNLTTALLNPETRNTRTIAQLHSVIDSFSAAQEDEGGAAATAAILDEILQPTETREVWINVIENFNNLAAQRNVDFDPAAFMAVWEEFGRLRGFSKNATR